MACTPRVFAVSSVSTFWSWNGIPLPLPELRTLIRQGFIWGIITPVVMQPPLRVLIISSDFAVILAFVFIKSFGRFMQHLLISRGPMRRNLSVFVMLPGSDVIPLI